MFRCWSNDEMEVAIIHGIATGYTVWGDSGMAMLRRERCRRFSSIGDITNSCGTGYGVIQLPWGQWLQQYQYAFAKPTSTVLTVEQLTAEEAVGRSVLNLPRCMICPTPKMPMMVLHRGNMARKRKVRSVNQKVKRDD